MANRLSTVESVAGSVDRAIGDNDCCVNGAVRRARYPTRVDEMML